MGCISTIWHLRKIKIALFYETSVDYSLGITDCKEPYERSKYLLTKPLKLSLNTSGLVLLSTRAEFFTKCLSLRPSPFLLSKSIILTSLIKRLRTWKRQTITCNGVSLSTLVAISSLVLFLLGVIPK